MFTLVGAIIADVLGLLSLNRAISRDPLQLALWAIIALASGIILDATVGRINR